MTPLFQVPSENFHTRYPKTRRRDKRNDARILSNIVKKQKGKNPEKYDFVKNKSLLILFILTKVKTSARIFSRTTTN